MLGANSVLASGSRIPSGELWAGNPARKIRDLTEDEQKSFIDGALRYWKIANEHLDEFYLSGTNYIEAEKIDDQLGHRLWDEIESSEKKL